MNNATFRGAVVLSALFLFVTLVAGCESGGSDMPRVEPAQNESKVRNFTSEEIDSLQALKARNGITRDEYWDDRGGVLANDVVEVWYPPGKLTVSHGMYVFDYVMKCRGQIARLVGRVPEGPLSVICTQTMDAYTEFTGRKWWHYASLEAGRIVYQPVPVLAGRGILDIALPRELYEWGIRYTTGDQAPLWLVEGMASFMAAEDAILQDNLTEFPDAPVKMTIDDIEAALAADDDKKSARLAYYNALMMVKRLDQEFGQGALGTMLTALAEGGSVDAAARSAFELSYDELVVRAQDWIPPVKAPEKEPE